MIWLGNHLVDLIVLGMRGRVTVDDILPTVGLLGLLGAGELVDSARPWSSWRLQWA